MNTTTDKTFLVSELNRVSRCVDFRHERDLRINSTTVLENIALACVMIKLSGLKSVGALESLRTADVALDALREDVDCLDARLRRPVNDNIDDAQDSIRSIISLA